MLIVLFVITIVKIVKENQQIVPNVIIIISWKIIIVTVAIMKIVEKKKMIIADVKPAKKVFI